ncbi:MAG: DNA mismatch repair protein MutS [Pseudomonadota bacterium]
MDAASPPAPHIDRRSAPTPMMAQYLAIKEQAGDALLFYRMGDFYELFFDDAVKAAGALDITLTKRGKHLGDDIPMCGVPWHSHESYLARLIKAGFKVAICEQTEDPKEAKKRGSNAVVNRAIVRVVTPGTLTEDTLLEPGRNNFLAALAVEGDVGALAWADVSTGELYWRRTDRTAFAGDLAALAPAELAAPEAETAVAWREALGEARAATCVSDLAAPFFSARRGEERLCETFGVASIDAFGTFEPVDLSALGSLLAYIELTQVGRAPALRPPRQASADAAMTIDAATRASLEIVRSSGGGKSGSLFWAVDRTVTAPGARLLASRLSAPLTDPAAIAARHDLVSAFVDAPSLREAVRTLLKGAPDMARALSRLTLGRGGPRDLSALAQGAQNAAEAAIALSADGGAGPLGALAATLNPQTDGGRLAVLAARLDKALKVDPPLLARDGGFIAKGFDPGLDEVRSLRGEADRHVANLEAKYREATGLKGLKIKKNNVLGVFVETPPGQADALSAPPHDATFIHRQTLASAVRFTTGELADLDGRIARARDEALARELDLFATLTEEAAGCADEIAATADALAQTDVAAAAAHLAATEDHVRPTVDDSLAFDIEAGRHPVVERAVSAQGAARFVANDCRLSEDGAPLLQLVTGPNMAGKSTYLRQNALIAVAAQAGLFVPAARAHLGVADRVFSRVGASDELAKGRSTFMVEMVETAAILNQATPRSLVVLDEIGRGTSTFDGLSIAWAAIEHLHGENRCRGLFATHYHELTALSETLPRLRNVSMRVREWKGKVVFLHEVGSGPADRSYGVAVARLAGLPSGVIKRAGDILKMLEADRRAGPGVDALPLFAAAPSENAAAQQETTDRSASDLSALAAALADIDPDALSPRDALDTLYRLKQLSGDG